MDKKMVDKRKVFNLNYEADILGITLETAYSLSEELDHTAQYYKAQLVDENEVSVEELVRKLSFFNNMLGMQLANLTEHTNSVKTVVKDLMKECR